MLAYEWVCVLGYNLPNAEERLRREGHRSPSTIFPHRFQDQL
jgi:hypothetical protein